MYPLSVSPEFCAQYMLWVLFLPEVGATRRGNVGQDLEPNPYYTDEDTIEKV